MRHLRIDDSSNVTELTWDRLPTEPVGHLLVKFKDATYWYDNVSIDQFKQACVAPSVGRWVSETLVRQPKTHPFTKTDSIDKAPGREQAALQLIASLKSSDSSVADQKLLAIAILTAREALR